MARVNYRNIEQHLGHIDGTIDGVTARIGSDGQLTDVSVRLIYHRWFDDAVPPHSRPEQHWEVVDPDPQDRGVTIHALEPVLVELSNSTEATDVWFSSDDPVLWPFEDWGEIMLNSDMDRLALFESVVSRIDSGDACSLVARYLPPYCSYRAPYSLGCFPRSLFVVVSEVLAEMGATTLVTREPRESEPLVALFIDDLTIVAEDYIVDVPEPTETGDDRSLSEVEQARLRLSKDTDARSSAAQAADARP
jgi:hypothetical protein